MAARLVLLSTQIPLLFSNDRAITRSQVKTPGEKGKNSCRAHPGRVLLRTCAQYPSPWRACRRVVTRDHSIVSTDIHAFILIRSNLSRRYLRKKLRWVASLRWWMHDSYAVTRCTFRSLLYRRPLRMRSDGRRSIQRFNKSSDHHAINLYLSQRPAPSKCSYSSNSNISYGYDQAPR